MFRPKNNLRTKRSEKEVVASDKIEKFTNSNYKAKLVGDPSYPDKLKTIIQDNPNNRFFQSLNDWIGAKRPLTKKQRQAIDSAYADYLIKYN